MIKRFFFICIVFALTQGIFVSAQGKKTRPLQKNPGTQKHLSVSERQEYEKVHKIFSQVDDIYREAWWVLTNERRTQQSNLFNKIARAAQTSLGLKVKYKSSFGCDRYQIKKSPNSQNQVWEIFENCQKSQTPKSLATLLIKPKQLFEIQFNNINLREVLGLNTATLGKNIHCSLKTDAQGLLKEIKCDNLAQDKNEKQQLVFKNFHYLRNHKRMLSLEGEILEELQVIRKLRADVPLSGKIVVYDEEIPTIDTPISISEESTPPPSLNQQKKVSQKTPLQHRTRDPHLIEAVNTRIHSRPVKKSEEDIDLEDPESNSTETVDHEVDSNENLNSRQNNDSSQSSTETSDQELENSEENNAPPSPQDGPLRQSNPEYVEESDSPAEKKSSPLEETGEAGGIRRPPSR